MAIKILCLGAFANGNLGDMYQADAVARLIKEVEPEAEVTSISPSKRGSAYPAQDHVAGPAEGAFDPAFINSFDLLIVGGGGLISAPHPPLNDPAWVEAVKIPICTLSLGAVEDTAALCRDFLRKCALFSVRDEFSLRVVQSECPDARIIMDPILLDQVVVPRPPLQPTAGIAWVPARLVLNTEIPWEAAMARAFNSRRDRLISFNPMTDRKSGFDTILPKVEYLDRIEPFLDAAFAARLVVSERYHGCIYALASGVPALGVCLRSQAVTSKIVELFRRVGHPDAIVRSPFNETREDLVARAKTIRMPAVREYLMEERERLLAYLSNCLQVAR